MSETVKLIVTLSKGQYEALKDIQFGGISSRMIFNAVRNGIPLDDVKAEISKTWYSKPNTKYDKGRKDQALEDMKIIDKHIKEADK